MLPTMCHRPVCPAPVSPVPRAGPVCTFPPGRPGMPVRLVCGRFPDRTGNVALGALAVKDEVASGDISSEALEWLRSRIVAGVDDKADKATTLAGYGITDARIENGVVTLGPASIAPLTSHQSLASCVTGGSYDSANRRILLTHGSVTLAEIDATAFIKDGMVSSVEIDDGDLVITFNTDAGLEPIEIPLADIFNPSNYYDKTGADARFVSKETGKRLMTDEEGAKLSGVDAGAKDNVVEAASASAFPQQGVTGKIYVAKDTNKTYRWGGSTYVEIANQDISDKADKADLRYDLVALAAGDYDLRDRATCSTSAANAPGIWKLDARNPAGIYGVVDDPEDTPEGRMSWYYGGAQKTLFLRKYGVLAECDVTEHYSDDSSATPADLPNEFQFYFYGVKNIRGSDLVATFTLTSYDGEALEGRGTVEIPSFGFSAAEATYAYVEGYGLFIVDVYNVLGPSQSRDDILTANLLFACPGPPVVGAAYSLSEEEDSQLILLSPMFKTPGLTLNAPSPVEGKVRDFAVVVDAPAATTLAIPGVKATDDDTFDLDAGRNAVYVTELAPGEMYATRRLVEEVVP